MNTQTFRDTVNEHRCHRSITLMEPYSQGRVTVTFHYDPDRASTFVWLTATNIDNAPVHVDGGQYALERDWHVSLFPENARRVWDDLIRAGWVEIARGSMGAPVTTK